MRNQKKKIYWHLTVNMPPEDAIDSDGLNGY